MPPKKPTPARAPAQPTPDQEAKDTPTAGAETSDSVAPTQRPSASPSVTRLDTLHQSPLGRGSPARGGIGGRPSARPRGVGRRSQKDRAELEKAESERKKAEADARERENAWKRTRDAARGRGAARGRARGGYMGDSERRASSSVASGPFSLGEVSSDVGKRRTGGGGGGGGGGGSSGQGGGRSGTSGQSGSRSSVITPGTGTGWGRGDGNQVKTEPGSNKDAIMTDVHIKAEDGGYISSDADDEGADSRKLNIDNLIDLTGEDDQEEASNAYLPPVRIQRVEHKERTVLANADGALNADGTIAVPDTNEVATASSEKRRGKQRAKDVEITGEKQKYKGTYSDTSSDKEDADVAIKTEPTDDSNMTSVTAGAVMNGSPPSSPDSRRKAKEALKTQVSFSTEEKPSFQTKEELLEWELHKRDLRILSAELGKLSVPSPAKPTNGESEAKPNDEPETIDPRADRVYLFQFPPVLPDLIPMALKSENEATSDAMDVDESKGEAKGEAKAEAKAEPTQTKAVPRKPGDQPKLPSGHIGKLRVHESGRAFLDWGGIPLEVCMGTEASFLQDVLITDFQSGDSKADADAMEEEGGGEKRSGLAMSMGQVKGKFVVVPEWDKIL